MGYPYKLRTDKEDLRDRVFSSTLYPTVAHLPSIVDLRMDMPPVVDQGNLGSCTSNAIADGLMWYYLWKHSGEDSVQLSRLYHYFHERMMEGTITEDSGASIRDGMKVAANGVCPELDWKYLVENFTVTPPASAEQDAPKYRISEYHRVTSLLNLKATLAHGQPVAMGIVIYESFESDGVAKDGRVPLPNPEIEKMLGGHAVLAVGYDDSKELVTVRNSWGDGWGDKGYFYLPYEFFNPMRHLVSDMWTAPGVVGF